MKHDSDQNQWTVNSTDNYLIFLVLFLSPSFFFCSHATAVADRKLDFTVAWIFQIGLHVLFYKSDDDFFPRRLSADTVDCSQVITTDPLVPFNPCNVSSPIKLIFVPRAHLLFEFPRIPKGPWFHFVRGTSLKVASNSPTTFYLRFKSRH